MTTEDSKENDEENDKKSVWGEQESFLKPNFPTPKRSRVIELEKSEKSFVELKKSMLKLGVDSVSVETKRRLIELAMAIKRNQLIAIAITRRIRVLNSIWQSDSSASVHFLNSDLNILHLIVRSKATASGWLTGIMCKCQSDGFATLWEQTFQREAILRTRGAIQQEIDAWMRHGQIVVHLS